MVRSSSMNSTTGTPASEKTMRRCCTACCAVRKGGPQTSPYSARVLGDRPGNRPRRAATCGCGPAVFRGPPFLSTPLTPPCPRSNALRRQVRPARGPTTSNAPATPWRHPGTWSRVRGSLFGGRHVPIQRTRPFNPAFPEQVVPAGPSVPPHPQGCFDQTQPASVTGAEAVRGELPRQSSLQHQMYGRRQAGHAYAQFRKIGAASIMRGPVRGVVVRRRRAAAATRGAVARRIAGRKWVPPIIRGGRSGPPWGTTARPAVRAPINHTKSQPIHHDINKSPVPSPPPSWFFVGQPRPSTG